MSITFNVIGDTLNAIVVDQNFDRIENYFNEGVPASDIADQSISKYVLRRYEASRIVQAHAMSNQFDVNQTRARDERVYGEYEYLFRDPLGYVLGSGDEQHGLMMELLGRPGPSFYWSYLEDGLSLSVTQPDKPKRYDERFCYSYWLTVPKATVRVYVPDNCIARIKGSAYFTALASAAFDFVRNGPGLASWLANYKVEGRQGTIRFALFVDENPGLTNEFVNNNQYLIDPNTGLQATHCSWQMIRKKTSYLGAWSQVNLTGDVALQGGKYYNFSLKFSPACKVGYAEQGGFVKEFFEYDVNSLAGYNSGVYNRRETVGVPPTEVGWISSELDIEFFYGHSNLTSDTTGQ